MSITELWPGIAEGLIIGLIGYAVWRVAASNRLLKRVAVLAGLGALAWVLVVCYQVVTDNPQASQPPGPDKPIGLTPTTVAPKPDKSPIQTLTAKSAPGPKSLDGLPNHGTTSIAAPSLGMLDTSPVALGQTLVLVVDTRRNAQPEISSEIAQRFKGNAGAFRRTFLETGSFDNAHDGNADGLKTVQGILKVPLILLVVATTSFRSNTIDSDIIEAELTLAVRVYRPASGFVTNLLHVRSNGAGTSKAAATTASAQRASDQLYRLLNENP